MKTLYLLRHAKSSWSEPGLSDQQRPLNSRGSRDAPAMGQRFSDRGESVDLVISSPARRAQDTARLFAGTCGYAPSEIETDANLYFLGSGSIEDVILAQDDRLQALMLVFHNPDITHFANSIDYDFHVYNIPTSGLVRFDCDIGSWRDWSPDVTAFDYFDYPKNDSGSVLRTASE